MAVVRLPLRPESSGWPIRVSIATVVVLAMLIVATVVIGMGWVGARESLLDTASRTASDSGALVTEKSRRLLEPARATLRQLAFDPIATAPTLRSRLERLHVLSEELAVNDLMASVYVAYSDGQFLLVRPLDKPELRQLFKAPPKANFMVQSRARGPGGRLQGEYLYFDAESRMVERRAAPEYSFDPRTRGWYQAASKTAAPVLSEPYVFFSTRQVGMTLSQSSEDGRAVLGIDVVLDDLSATLGSMKMTPNTQMALVNAQHEVLAYPDMARVLTQTDGRFSFKTVQALGEPSLVELEAANPPLGEATLLKSGRQEVLGVILPFDVWQGQGMRMLITAPVDELLGDLSAKRRRLILMVLGLVLLMLPVGWLAGGRIGRSLDRLTVQAQRIGRFDFSGAEVPSSHVKEVNQLTGVMQGMSHTIQSFLGLSRQMATEPQVEKMLEQVLHQLVEATRCAAAAVYLWDHEAQRMQRAAVDGDAAERFAEGFTYPHGRTPRTAARQLADGLQQMELELRGRSGPLQGLLVLVHVADAGHTDPAFVRFAHQLSGMLAVSIETRQLIEAQKNLLDAVIRLMADAIDAKSPYTGGHCERVPELATLLVDRMSADTEGPYAEFRMTEDERYEFYLAAWLHDCGKVTSPEHIVDKATKLEVICNRIHEVRMRFEVLWRDAEIEHLQRVAQGHAMADSLALRDARHRQLQDDFAFVAQCNVGGEFMADAALERLQAVASQTWQRHFDDRLGLASEEARRLAQARPLAPELPATELLLADRPEHVVPWDGRRPPVEKDDPANRHGFDMALPPHRQNMGEVYNLSIRRGTLTDEDRFKINDHIVQTYIMLKRLPWPEQLRRVPEIAANHHEKMDGRGYPRKLPAERLTVADRVMALADIFEALTAADRPYKAPKTLTESLRIMAFMCKDQHIDTELFRYFLHSGLWREFATRYMAPSQIDAVDVTAIDKLLPVSAASQPEVKA
jgi:HD-GYP domain-containing protein (c-di-GMP phosphodiesterase class II)